jgi:autotransporter-associated beta strand protein
LGGGITTSGRPFMLIGGNIDVTGQISGSATNSTLNVVNANVVLENTNSYNGPTNVTGGGLLQNGVQNALPSGTTLTLGETTNNTSGTYDLSGFDQTIGGLNSAGNGTQTVTNSGASGVNTLTFSGTGTFAGTIKDGASAATAVATTTGAAQVLAGANTYGGTTTVYAGTLIVSGSLNGTASVAVNGGTLGGTGTITTSGNGNVMVGSAGSLAPGNGGPGTLTLALGSGSLDFSAATASIGWLNFDLGTSSDKISLTTGALNLGTGFGLSDFNFTDAGGFGQGTYVLFAADNPIQGTLGSNVTGSVLGLNATLQFADGGNELVLNVVPEADVAATLLGGLGALVSFQRLRPGRSRFNRRKF